MAEPTSSSTSSRIWSIEDILRIEPEEPSKSAVLQSRTNYGPLKVQQLKPRSMKSVSGSRFPQPLTPQEMKENSKPFVPTRTMCNNRWAVNVFNQWVAFRNSQPNALLKCPIDLLEVYPTTIVDDWLAAFILEVRRVDGDFYPGSTLKNILPALFRVMKGNLGARNIVSFIEKSSQERYYPRLHGALDRQLRLLRCNGIGLQKKRTEVITPQIEQKLWDDGILGLHSPSSLLNAVFYLNGKNFHLRGVQEQATLRFSQLLRFTNPDRYVYYEHGSKNHSGGLNDPSEGKVVPIAAIQTPRCHVAVLDFYFSKLPPLAVQSDSLFYMKPLPFTPMGPRPWFWDEPCPKNRLRTMVKTMMTEANITGNFTNHSLRATGTTALFDSGTPEAIIQKRTGHRSLTALRMYKRVTPKQELAVAEVLGNYSHAKETDDMYHFDLPFMPKHSSP